MGDLLAIADRGAGHAAPFVRVKVPGPPKGKKRHRARIVFPKQGKPFVHEYPDPDGVAYEESIAWCARAAMKGKEPLTGPLEVRVYAMMPVPKSWSQKDRDAALTGQILHTSRPDGDNIAKAGSDAMNGIVWKDDSQIVRWTIVKEYAEHPGLWIEVYALA